MLLFTNIVRAMKSKGLTKQEVLAGIRSKVALEVVGIELTDLQHKELVAFCRKPKAHMSDLYDVALGVF